MAKNVRADALVCHPCTLTDPLKHQVDAIFRQGQACFGEKEMILASTAPFGQFLLIGPVAVQVVEQIPQAVVPERNASLFGALAFDDQEPTFAVKVAQTEIAELCEPDAGIVEQP